MNFKLTSVVASAAIPAEMRRLYEISFPVEERRSWESLCRLLDDEGSGYAVKVVEVAGGFAGFITVWRLDGVVYVEHFAIEECYRGCGLGGDVIDRIVSEAVCPVVLEVEMPETGAMAERRIGFYRRHGFTGCADFNYIQPSYETGEPLMPLMLMVSGHVSDLASVAKNIRRKVYGADW